MRTFARRVTLFLYFCEVFWDMCESGLVRHFCCFHLKLYNNLASTYFDFKKFRVYHDRCAQKVGTDGVVLGAWVNIEGAKSILDIGTGSGLIALMVAQREPEAKVMGVDIDESAVGQACENVAASPFADRIRIVHADVRDFCKQPSSFESDCSPLMFDHIICNPPFYVEDTLPPDATRALARNAALLPFEDLVKSVAEMLAPEGCFSVMLPMSCRDYFTVLCEASSMHLIRQCTVQTVQRKAPKRILITYSRKRVEDVVKESLILQDGNEKSEAYKYLARDFYL